MTDTTATPLTDQQLDEIRARAEVATDGPWERYEQYGPDFFACTTGSYLRGVGTFNFGDGTDAEADEEFVKHAVQDVRALVDEVARLKARVAELEGPAVEARAALAALCYDLEDPGSNALGALYLLSQATVGVEAPKDDAAAALAQHARQVLHRVADMADPEPPEVSFFGGQVGPAVAAWLQMLATQPRTAEALAAGEAPGAAR